MSDVTPDNPSLRRFELPPVREFNDRATLWLLEDPRNLGDLLRIHSPQLVEHLDFAHAERINRSFIPADLQKQESDLLFRVPFVQQSGQEETILTIWVYLLLEHQSRPVDGAATALLYARTMELTASGVGTEPDTSLLTPPDSGRAVRILYRRRKLESFAAVS
jgi:hypothetical protein